MHLLEGDVNTANSYLGYNYSITGSIIEGKKIGRTINFPTANIKVSEEYKLIPKNGVYIVSVELNDKLYYGMMNIGTNPTISKGNQSIEVHIFDFDESVYDENIKINFLDRIRDEKKHESLEELKLQLEKDKHTSLSKIKSY